jgi:hypothetical protein
LASPSAGWKSRIAATPRKNTIPAAINGSVIVAIGFPFLDQLHDIANVPETLFKAGVYFCFSLGAGAPLGPLGHFRPSQKKPPAIAAKNR